MNLEQVRELAGRLRRFERNQNSLDDCVAFLATAQRDLTALVVKVLDQNAEIRRLEFELEEALGRTPDLTTTSEDLEP